ncbi:MAG TPA: hypothetical protein VI636_03985 [Candidatus Angelobacter sp.]
MPVSFRHMVSVIVAFGGLLFPALAAGGQVAPKAQISPQYKMAADEAVKNPFRVDVQPVQQGITQGASVVLKIQIHNANNELVNTNAPMSFLVKIKSPAGKEQVQKVDIGSGSHEGQTTVLADEKGLWKLEVRESNDHLISGSSYLLVSPPQQVERAMPKPARRRSAVPRPPGSAFMFAPRLVLASYRPQGPGPVGPDTGSSAKPKISVTVSGDADNKVLADGIAVAVVRVFLYPPQPNDVRIFLNASAGTVSPQPVVIKAGDFEGDGKWTSKSIAANASVSISEVNPPIDTEVLPNSSIDFVDPIVAITFSNPPSGLNIVERGTVIVHFIDRNGLPVPAHAPLSFSLNASSPRLRLVPDSDQTKPDAFDFQASVIPSGLGTVTIQAAVPHLQPITQAIEVKGLLLLILCALGGALGGLVNHLDRKQKGLVASLVTGMVVTLPITWLYVWVGLPHVDAAILHNQLSAVMVAVIAGMSGASGLKLAAKQFKISLFESAEENAAGAAA